MIGKSIKTAVAALCFGLLVLLSASFCEATSGKPFDPALHPEFYYVKGGLAVPFKCQDESAEWKEYFIGPSGDSGAESALE